MAATEKGVWNLQEVRDKQLVSEWSYDGVSAWFGMGKNTYGDLGLNDLVKRSSPTQLPADPTWSKINCNSGRGFFGLKTDGTAWAWGYNAQGQLGINIGKLPYVASVDRSSPTQIGTDTNWGSNFSRNDTDSLWIKTDGTLWSWGYGMYGVLGLNETNTGWPNYSGLKSSPTQIGTDTTWSDVLVGGSTGLAIKTNGTLWAWGYGLSGAPGQNDRTTRSSPTQVGTGTDWSKIGTCSHTNFAIKTDGSAWSWGGDQFGKTGLNSEGVSKSSPTQIPGTWNSFSTSAAHVLATKTNGTLWSWGYNPFGNLGLNDRGSGGSTSRSSPTQIPGTTWYEATGGYLTSIATKTDGTLWTWGENEGGQMGHNTSGSPTAGAISSPTQIPGTGWSDPSASREEFYVKNQL